MRRALLVTALVLGLAACSSGDDGDTASESGITSTNGVADPPSLASTAFAEGEAIPVENGGCPPGDNQSPPLAWSGLPADADQLAITFTDPDAAGFVHWVVAGIDPSSTAVDAGEEPPGSVAALNDTGQAGYFGPCPPETHTYVFTVHALSDDPGLTPTTPGPEAVDAVEAVTTASADLSGTFTPSAP